MEQTKLIKVSVEHAEKIREYRAGFPTDRTRVTYNPARIPGMDYLEKYGDGLKYENVLDWLKFCEDMSDKLTWYMSIRENDGKIVGFWDSSGFDLAVIEDLDHFCKDRRHIRVLIDRHGRDLVSRHHRLLGRNSSCSST